MNASVSARRLPLAVIIVASLAGGAPVAAQSSRAGAIAAADAAAGMPDAPLDPAIPTCAAPPPSGEKLAGDMELSGEGHSMEFENGGGGDAIVKLRHAKTSKLAASFIVHRREQVTIDGVPDGDYIIQYAFGPALAADCRSFVRIIMANQLPDIDHLKTEVIDDEDKTETKRMSVSYQLSVSETSNVKPVRIDVAAFNAD